MQKHETKIVAHDFLSTPEYFFFFVDGKNNELETYLLFKHCYAWGWTRKRKKTRKRRLHKMRDENHRSKTSSTQRPMKRKKGKKAKGNNEASESKMNGKSGICCGENKKIGSCVDLKSGIARSRIWKLIFKICHVLKLKSSQNDFLLLTNNFLSA